MSVHFVCLWSPDPRFLSLSLSLSLSFCVCVCLFSLFQRYIYLRKDCLSIWLHTINAWLTGWLTDSRNWITVYLFQTYFQYKTDRHDIIFISHLPISIPSLSFFFTIFLLVWAFFCCCVLYSFDFIWFFFFCCCCPIWLATLSVSQSLHNGPSLLGFCFVFFFFFMDVFLNVLWSVIIDHI